MAGMVRYSPIKPNYAAAVMRDDAAMGTLVRSVITAANAKFNPSVTTDTFVRRRWGEGEVANIAQVLRAASAPAMTSTTGWAKELGQTTFAFLANLVPLSAGADLLGRSGLQLTFDGANAISIPNVTAPLADFVAQGAPIPVVSGTSSVQAILEPHKFGCIVVLTREMVESGNAEALTRQALLDAMGPSLDRRLFDANAAVADLRPPGLLFGKTPLPSTTMAADLAKLAAAVAPYAGNGGIVFIAAAAQAVAITIGLFRGLDYPLLTSTTLAAGTVIAVARPALVAALGAAPLIDETKAATMHMDTAPQPIASGGTMAGPSTTVTFQTDKIALRLRWPLGWSLRDANAIAFMNAVTWP
jgi:hypothetical protein